VGSGSAKKDEPKKDAKKDVAKKDDKAKKPVGLPIAEAKAKLEAVRKDVAAKKRKFADAATELSTDEVMKATGGEVGWRTVENPQLGDKLLNDQVKELKAGDMTPVIETAKGVYLILVEDKRPVAGKKDLEYDEVKLEIAADLAKTTWSKEAAKRAAITALAEAKGKLLGDLYKESMEDQIRRTVEQQRTRCRAADAELPRCSCPTRRWRGRPTTTRLIGGGGAPTGSAKPTAPLTGSGSAKPTAPLTGSGSAKPTAPLTGSGSGVGGGSAGTGSGSGAPAPAPTPKVPPALAPIEPTKDDLPKFGDIAKPNLKRHLNISRGPFVPSLPKELIPTLFDVMVDGMLADRIYEADGSFVIFQVTLKGRADMGEFEKAAGGEIAKLRLFRSGYLVEDWMKTRCEQLAKEEKIRVPEDLKQPDKPEIGPDGKPLPVPPTPGYRTCMTFSRH
jgi:hypothetical protein